MHPFKHSRLQAIAAYLDGVRAELAAVVTAASLESMQRSRSPERWTGAQIIHHLGKVEGSTAKMLERLFGNPEAGALPEDVETSSMLTTLDRFSAGGEVLRPLVAPERLRPDPAPELNASWESLQSVRERTYRAYSTVDGRDLTKLFAPHPFFGPLNAYEWLVFLGKHEERHLGQLRRELSA